MKNLIILCFVSFLFFSSCEDTINETLPENIFTEEVDFVEIIAHSYLSEENKGKIEFTVDFDVFSAAQRGRITSLYFQYDEITRRILDLEQRTFVFPILRGETCIRFGIGAGDVLSNPGPETCITF